MLLKKYTIISLALVFTLLGCQSGSQDSSDIVNINPDTVIELPELEEDDTSIRPILEGETKSSNWYIRIVAQDVNRALKTHSAQLGALEESDALVKHTLISRSRIFSGPYLDIVFVDPDGVEAGEYKTNYHTFQKGMEDRWRFTVRTDDDTSEILLTWRGLYLLTPYIDDKNRKQYKEYRSVTNPLIKHMKLVDVDTGAEMAASIDGKIQTYVLNMNGQNERIFEWVVQTEVVELPLVSSKSLSISTKSIQNDVDKIVTTTVEKRAESFDLSKPPTFIGESDGK